MPGRCQHPGTAGSKRKFWLWPPSIAAAARTRHPAAWFCQWRASKIRLYPRKKCVGSPAATWAPSACQIYEKKQLLAYLGRSDAACIVRDDANCANKRKPSEYFKDQIVVDSMVFSSEALRHLVAETGVSQVVYGSDMPYFWPDTIDIIAEAPFLSDADKEAILGGNLRRLLRIGA